MVNVVAPNFYLNRKKVPEIPNFRDFSVAAEIWEPQQSLQRHFA
jgi:hypothetical protein